ncbi:hypothetical protein F1559_001755 [Cyanidiococcus yangmingshanensis]|uniref:PHD finger protein n=1 Tax=Cyanidiococcus yangmingshanensis TaxID=2690220 RepID=A0A7J7IKI9_9RHOD|nr:hypothetical protein F1559_001755 [Cyanidiococcus yangmingshanensis]
MLGNGWSKTLVGWFSLHRTPPGCVRSFPLHRPNLMTDPMQAAVARAKHNHRRGIVCEACVLRNRLRAQQLSADKPKLAENDAAGEASILGAHLESQSALRSSDLISDKLDDNCRGAGLAHPVFFKPAVLFLGSEIQSTAAKGDGLHSPIKPDRGGAVERSCEVCISSEQSKENRLWRCHGCGTVVHQACYGISERVEHTDRLVDTKWLCRPCEQTYAHAPSRRAASVLRKSIRCSLCGAATGALKPATNGAWAHIFCALCAPDTSLGDMGTMEPIVGLDKIPAHRRHLRCVICHKSTGCGGVIRCHWADCSASFHASCGRRGGYLFLISERESLEAMLKQSRAQDAYRLSAHWRSMVPVVALCFCREHTRKALHRLSTPVQRTKAINNPSAPAPERLPLGAGQPAVTHEYDLSPRKIRELHKRNELRPYLRTLRVRVMSGLEALEKAKQRFKHIHSNGFSCQACLCRSVSRKLYDALCRFNRVAASFETRRGTVVGRSPAMVSAQRLGAIMGEIEQVLAHQASVVFSEKREPTDKPSISENESSPDADLTEETTLATTNALAWLSSFAHFEESDHNHDDAIDSAKSSRVADTTKTGNKPTTARLRFRMMIDQSGIAIEGEYGWPKSESPTAREPSSLEARGLALLWYRVVPADTPIQESRYGIGTSVALK